MNRNHTFRQACRPLIAIAVLGLLVTTMRHAQQTLAQGLRLRRGLGVPGLNRYWRERRTRAGNLRAKNETM